MDIWRQIIQLMKRISKVYYVKIKIAKKDYR
jgi:hypothetical protein